MKTSKNKLVDRFIIGTFVSLYILVSVVSTIHVVDFFELSNPSWLAITLAIGFELGAAASLAALITLDKMNKSLVWALFITITAMQMQGNMYYAFINLEDYQGWVELFNLLEWEPLAQKRLLAAVSGAILPLVALGFIKSLVDYIKPEKESDDIRPEDLDVIAEEINSSEKKTNIVSDDTQIAYPEEIPFSEEELNNMATFTKKDVETMVEANDNPKEPNDALIEASKEYDAFGQEMNDSIVKRVETPHLPKEDGLINNLDSSSVVVSKKNYKNHRSYWTSAETRIDDNKL
jgi:hypothetical protein|tara:strand:- start:2281 stop:3153 length:873 start_codon:yes stop_codon:yes gene_type:complete